ncbi:ABC transporter ATP-binding protein [Butyrivibrio hungatei]|uniref:Polysaccharide/polyol phosphate ABC transporter ATP-binding protein n=1 Tax=Butyrivibrio hungatei TaxID=185008 RepID=A0A1D9NZW2_9FIRM|nr:ABC transporter ATP-binding protein [Butyrivibrio hungatei]AOZ95485.1 polysaccharide/polyol phosphate ABC transporter ATP-binding protein [Butyrivibrio hungatei]
MSDTVIKIEGLRKQYRLGTIGGGTLTADLQSWWAKKRGKEDPNTKIGTNCAETGDSFYAIDGIDLEVHKGETIGIIGANGAGKSTLLKLLCRVTAPTEGTIRMKGRIASMLEVGTGFHPELTGRENIYMNGAILGMTKSEIDSKIEEIIDFSECRQFIDTPVKRYSSGMYVKLAFAVAAHLDAEIMIMDEVLAVGDVKFQQKCLGKMENAAAGEGKTVLYVSHNMATIRQLCNRCIVLEHGKIVFDGDVERGIEKYVGLGNVDYKPFYDFSDTKRPSLDHGRTLFVHSLTFENKQQAVYSSLEKMIFSIEYTPNVDDENIGVYFSVVAMDDSPVGTTFSGIIDNSKKGVRTKKTLEFDIANLVDGTYYFYLDIFYTNEFGTFNSCDHPMEKVFFEVGKDASTSQWNKRYFGNIKLPSLKLVGQK